MGRLIDLYGNDKYQQSVLEHGLEVTLEAIAYLSAKNGYPDLKNNKRLQKSLNQLKNSAYILKTELVRLKNARY